MYKACVHAALEPDLFHFRDDRGLGVDLILDVGSDITAVECKAGATVASDFFDGLETFQKRAEARLPHVRVECRLVYGGEQRQRRRGARVVPWREVPALSP